MKQSKKREIVLIHFPNVNICRLHIGKCICSRYYIMAFARMYMVYQFTLDNHTFNQFNYHCYSLLNKHTHTLYTTQYYNK